MLKLNSLTLQVLGGRVHPPSTWGQCRWRGEPRVELWPSTAPPASHLIINYADWKVVHTTLSVQQDGRRKDTWSLIHPRKVKDKSCWRQTIGSRDHPELKSWAEEEGVSKWQHKSDGTPSDFFLRCSLHNALSFLHPCVHAHFLLLNFDTHPVPRYESVL